VTTPTVDLPPALDFLPRTPVAAWERDNSALFVAKGKRGGIAAEHAKQKRRRPQRPCHGGPTTHNRRLPTPGSRSRFPRKAGPATSGPGGASRQGSRAGSARDRMRGKGVAGSLWFPSVERDPTVLVRLEDEFG
jgi:hypothetical protein